MNTLARSCHWCSTLWADTAATSQCPHRKMQAMLVWTSAAPSTWSPDSNLLSFDQLDAGCRRPRGPPTLTWLMLFSMIWNGLVWNPMKWRRQLRTQALAFNCESCLLDALAWELIDWCTVISHIVIIPSVILQRKDIWKPHIICYKISQNILVYISLKI